MNFTWEEAKNKCFKSQVESVTNQEAVGNSDEAIIMTKRIGGQKYVFKLTYKYYRLSHLLPCLNSREAYEPRRIYTASSIVRSFFLEKIKQIYVDGGGVYEN